MAPLTTLMASCRCSGAGSSALVHFLGGAVLLLTVGCASETITPGPVDPDAPTEFTERPSGLKYRILRKSDGRLPFASDRVTVHYEGKLDDGTVFDSSYKRGKPTTFALSGVIQGWTEGLQLIGEGGMIELIIPHELGYGSEGNAPKVPPNATLHFTVELLKFPKMIGPAPGTN